MNPQDRIVYEALKAGDEAKLLGLVGELEEPPNFPAGDLQELAILLEGHQRYLAAARACRALAESWPEAAERPAALVRGAALLLGPIDNRQAGMSMLRAFNLSYPDHPLQAAVETLTLALHSGERIPWPAELLSACPDEPPPSAKAACQSGSPAQSHWPASSPLSVTAPSSLQPDALTQREPAQRTGLSLLQKLQAELTKALALALLICLGLLLISSMIRDNLRGVDEIHPAVLEEPVQGPPERAPFKLDRLGYDFYIEPRAEYEIAGLLVSKHDYASGAWQRFNRFVPMDLCLIWGANVGRERFRDEQTEFSQSGRFCRVSFPGGTHFNMKALSNNHMILSDEALSDVLDEMHIGDSVRIKGMLVHVEAHLQPGEESLFDGDFTYSSSLTREEWR